MSDTLYDSLIKYKKLNRVSFHTPGHKGCNFLNDEITSLDLTELPLTDSLYEASGCIKESEEKMAKLYGAKATLFSAGGNTLCIQTMIALAVGYGGKMLVGRNVHRSVVSTMALLNIEPVWIMNRRDAGKGIPGRIYKEDVYKALCIHRDIKAVFITSPDYYGVISDIGGIADVCKQFGVPLLVDNAHGSHFICTKENLHPINLGAAMSADSLHKTLPVLTGGAVLHINDDKYINNAKNCMSIFGSTSPSYPIMTSIDLCRKWLESQGMYLYNCLEEKVSYIKNVISNLGIPMPIGLCDQTRISLNVAFVGYSGYEFRNCLYKYNIEPEYCDDNYVVLIVSPFNGAGDLNLLLDCIRKVKVKKSIYTECGNVIVPKVEMSIKDAMFLNYETVDIDFSCGKIAAEILCPCPPGVPVVMPGEVIGDCQKIMLRNYGISQVKVVK